MKIKNVRATPVRVPVTRVGTYSSKTRKLTHVLSTIVEIETECGAIGLGETRYLWPTPIINERFAPILKNMHVFDRRAAFQACVPMHFDYGYPERACEVTAWAGVDMALWDLLGQHTGQPIFRLLGGPVRERALFTGYAYAPDLEQGIAVSHVPETVAQIASQQVDDYGIKLFEFKIGRHSLECDIATVQAVRASVGNHVDLAVDVNMGFTVEQTRRFLHGVRDYRLANIEEPVTGLANIDRLRTEFDVPMSTHDYNLDALQAHQHIDALVSDITLHGGFEPIIETMIRVNALGKRFWQRARWELGITWAAMCHLGIARPELDRPSQSVIYFLEDDLIEGETWMVQNGGVRPPELPGLGITLDRTALARYAVD